MVYFSMRLADCDLGARDRNVNKSSCCGVTLEEDRVPPTAGTHVIDSTTAECERGFVRDTSVVKCVERK